MSKRRQVQPLARKMGKDRPPAVPNMAVRRGRSCLGLTLAIFLMMGILILLLMAAEVLPVPSLNSLQRNTRTPAPSATPIPSETMELVLVQSATPTATTAATSAPTSTATNAPTATALPSITPQASSTEKLMPYLLRGTPEAYPNSLLHSEYSCEEYLFIGGQVWDLQERPVKALTVRLMGTYGGSTVDFTTGSGTTLTIFGASGFEFVLKNKQIAEENLYLLLEDSTGEALSSRIPLSISGSCDGNLLIVNFKQVR